MRQHVRALGAYAASVVISALITLVTIPIIVAKAGAVEWACLAVGQAVGTGAAVLIGYGWGTTGPTLAAQTRPHLRPAFYLDSFRARILVALPVMPVACIVTFLSVSEAKIESVLNAFGYGITGLLAGWFFTGVGKSFAFVLLDTMPRVLGAAVGLCAVLLGGPLVLFPLCQAVGILGGVVTSTRVISGDARAQPNSWTIREGLRSLQGQSHGLVIAVVAAAYAAVPSAIISVVLPASLPAYALTDKLLRFGTTAYSPVIQMLQGWVPGGPRQRVVRRVRIAFGGGLVLTGAAVLGFVILAPLLSSVLSHGQVDPSEDLTWGFAVTLGAMALAQVVGLVCLVALGRARRLALFTTVGALVGLPGVFVGATIVGVTGAVWMLAVGELVALGLQLGLLFRASWGGEPIPREEIAEDDGLGPYLDTRERGA